MKHAITVYTCCVDRRDGVRADQNREGAQFVAFSDQPAVPEGWQRHAASALFASPRRNARMHKILAHQYVSTAYSVWMDANVALRVPAAVLVADYLQECDVAVFRHRTRACTYEEADTCAALGLDSPAILQAQAARYRAAGLAPGLGLAETSVVIRRHCPQVEQFNNLWWSELCAHSVRDQVSFMYAASRLGVRVGFITPTKFDHPYFSMTVRPPGRETASHAAIGI